MKKAESLSASLFRKFEEDRISGLAQCVGGQKYTTYDKVTCQPVDCADTGSSDGHSIGGEKCDWSASAC